MSQLGLHEPSKYPYRCSFVSCRFCDGKGEYERYVSGDHVPDIVPCLIRSAHDEAAHSEEHNRWLIRKNADKDTHYAPYCMRCPGAKRMSKVEKYYWRCRCGAEHDERQHA